jgi:CRP-like cAMP-binding protein
MRPRVPGLPVTSYATFVRQVPLLAGLSEPTVATLVPHLRPHRYPKQAILFQAQDPSTALFLLTTGTVKLTLEAADGRALRLATLRPPACFGEMALLEGGAQGVQATTLTPCEVLWLPRPTVLALLEDAPQVVHALARHLIQLLRAAGGLSARVAWWNAHARVAHVVLPPRPAGEGAPPSGPPPGTPAGAPGLARADGPRARDHSEVLRDFHQAGVLEVVGGQVQVLDAGRLAQVQGGAGADGRPRPARPRAGACP